MILERHRELTINLGNNTYESAKISARVYLDTDKMSFGERNGRSPEETTDWSWLVNYADKLLTDALAKEVDYWHHITTKSDSFIHLVQEDNKERESENA